VAWAVYETSRGGSRSPAPEIGSLLRNMREWFVVHCLQTVRGARCIMGEGPVRVVLPMGVGNIVSGRMVISVKSVRN
jgi:hypothetical protein